MGKGFAEYGWLSERHMNNLPPKGRFYKKKRQKPAD
jgi:hypothetical protein